MNNKHVVFGQVVNLDEADKILAKLENVKVNQRERPLRPVTIINCGELGDKTSFLRNDPFSKENMEKIKEANKFNRLYLEEKDHYMKEERQKKEKEKREAEELKQKEQMKKDIKDKYDQNNLIGKRNYNVALDTNNNLKNDNSITVNQNKNQDPTKNNLETNEEVTTLKPYQAQFMESIRNKINKKISENFEIVAEAKLEEAEGGQTQKRFKLSRKKRRIAAKKRKKELEEGNHKARIGLLHQTAFENDRRKKKKQEMFGWNVFNEDAKYNAYKKRLKE